MRLEADRGPGVTRRRLLVTGGLGLGLVVAWAAWPRRYESNLVAGKGEHIYNAFLKIGEDGRVIVAVPQAETGQGVYTTLPQIVADELGADWRTVGVEASPINPLYANRLFAEELAGAVAPSFQSVADEFATRSAVMVTAGSTSIRMFEIPLREAAAAARVRLCKAAAARWDMDWEGCDVDSGFVVYESRRLRFGELAAEAAGLDAPDPAPLRTGERGRFVGQSVPRLDTPAKLDGSMNFAADVRLPNMVFAAMRQGPIGATRYAGAGDKPAADRVRGVSHVIETEEWVATVASTSWAAERALEAMRPRFETQGALASDTLIAERLQAALDDEGAAIVSRGDPEDALVGAGLYTATYGVAPAAHASLEPMTATASWSDGNLSLWLPTIAPEAIRHVVASRLDLSPARVAIHPTMVGGGFGRGMQPDAAVQAGWLARQLKRPVQLFWSRAEGILRDQFRPPARARLTGKASGGKLHALLARIAAPSYGRSLAEALTPGSALARQLSGWAPDGYAVTGAETPYRIDHVTVRHHVAELPIPTGYWRSGPYSYTAFFTESFVDEVAHAAGVEPFSFRMAMLGGRPRLARCLSTAAALGGWQGGGLGTGQGLAVHAAHGSFIAVLVEAQTEAGRIRCDRIVAVADAGRLIHPDIVRQQIEGGLIFGLAATTGCAPGFENGLTRARRLGDLNLPRLAGSPEITVELLPSTEEPGGVSEIAVPPVAPALANALYAATGRRHRDLPIRLS